MGIYCRLVFLGRSVGTRVPADQPGLDPPPDAHVRRAGQTLAVLLAFDPQPLHLVHIPSPPVFSSILIPLIFIAIGTDPLLVPKQELVVF